MPADLFVCYAREDREPVMAWVRRLQEAGVSLWVDERGLDGARQWGAEIVDAVDGCKLLLLFLSPAAVASDHVVREVSLAMDAAKPILPLVLQPAVLPPGLQYPLAGIQHLELFHGEGGAHLTGILRALSHFGIQASAAVPPSTTSAEPVAAAAPSLSAPSASPERVSIPHNLPRLLSRFIGRRRELDAIRQQLEGARLLTLIGPGGSGKTRLALQAADERLDRHPDGIWLIELEALAEPSLLCQTVAAGLGVREEAGRPLADTLADFLRSRSVLLLLDNCEHLIAACAALAQSLLRACPHLKILATSREALGVRGEVIQRVPSLSIPDAQIERAIGTDRVSAALQYEAVQLFVERAGAVQPSFALTEQNASEVAQVCRRLDGIPLALELAAARVKLLSVEQISQRLDDRFRLLTGGSRTALPRQQTLRAAIDWSYELLTEAERGLLRRLAIFVGGWSLAAAEAVCAGDAIDEWEVLDLLTQLTDKSLVVVDNADAAEARYSLLETIREYGYECLQKGGEGEPIQERHAQYFLAMAEDREGEEQPWLDRLEAEIGNLRAALTWLLRGSRVNEAYRLATRLWRLWYLRGAWTEGREWLAGVLALPAPPSEERAMLLRQAGQLAWLQTDYPAARTLLEQSLALYRELGNTDDLPAPLNALGEVSRTQGDYATARAYFQESLALLRARGDKGNQAWALQALGEVAQEEGDAAARALAEESLALFQEVDDRRGVSFALSHLGEVARAHGELDRARHLHEESLAIRRELGYKGGVARSLGYLGAVAVGQDDYEQAAALYRESLLLRRELGDRRSIAACLELLAGLATSQGQLERAAPLFGAAEALRQSLGAPLPPADRAEYDRHVGLLRSQLPADLLTSAWSSGGAMSLDQALNFALENTGSRPVPASA